MTIDTRALRLTIDACIERARTILQFAVVAANARRATAFDPLRGLYVTEAEVAEILARSSAKRDVDLEVAWAIAELTPITDAPAVHDILAIAVAAEYVPRLDRVFGFLHDDLTRRTLTVGLVVEMLGVDPALFSRDGLLARLAVVHIGESAVPLGSSICIDRGLLGRLAGHSTLDPRIRGIATSSGARAAHSDVPYTGWESPLVLWGASADDIAAAARDVCTQAGMPAIRISDEATLDHVGIAARDAILNDAMLIVEAPDPSKARSIACAVADFPLRVVIEAPGGVTRYDGASMRVTSTAPVSAVPAGYPLPYGRRILARRSMDEVILPPSQLRSLQAIVQRMTKQHVVTREWGVDTGSSIGGVRALFAGPPGTGKTLAAEALAHRLGRDLYVVDLSMVVSKYIGETEKALATIFTEAARAGVCLFFDEADALFGKRTEAKDAHDRYANIETAYLLRAIDDYPDIVILASNLAVNIDDALLRRIDVKIDFVMPGVSARERLWRKAFAQAPLDDVDIADLSRRLQLSGGSIQSAALTAAYRAAAEERSITTVDILRAARDEFAKAGRLVGRVELGDAYERIVGEDAI